MTNAGKWNMAFKRLSAPWPFGSDKRSYSLAADFLSGCDRVEDWGCGAGYFGTMIAREKYVGIDGSRTPFASVVADLCDYRSNTEAIFVRHVLEHNWRWRKILANAIASFTRNLAIAIYTPWNLGRVAVSIGRAKKVDVPVLSLPKMEIVEALSVGMSYKLIELDNPGGVYGQEHVLLVSKNGADDE